ncbi:MAG: oligopeptide/dipeptide ABC transporter ATP-binding protein, partial [Propionibacteriaceae bacterium]
DVFDLYANPAHPYTKGLLDSIPRLDQKGQELAAIGGLPPNLMRIPPGCPFNPRCIYAQDVCTVDPPPPLRNVAHHRLSACHFSEDLMAGTIQVTRQRIELSDADAGEHTALPMGSDTYLAAGDIGGGSSE